MITVLKEVPSTGYTHLLKAKHEWRVREVTAPVGEYPVIRRGFRIWLTDTLEYYADRLQQFITSAYGDAGIPNRFRDGVLVQCCFQDCDDTSWATQDWIGCLTDSRCRVLGSSQDEGRLCYACLPRAREQNRSDCSAPVGRWSGASLDVPRCKKHDVNCG